MRNWRLTVLAVVAMLLAACAPRAGGPSPAAPQRAPTAATLPAEAKRPLGELVPRIERPADAPDADKLPERAAEIVQQAEGFLAQREFTKAATLLDRAKGFAPASPRILRDLGLAYAELGDRAKAEPALRASAQSAPDHVRVNLLLGAYATIQHQHDQAILDFRRALLCSDAKDDNPDTGETLLRLGTLLEQQGCLAAALDCYRRLGELVAAHGRAYADRAPLRLLVTQPERLLVSRGKVLLRLGRVAEAAGPLEQAYRRDKTHPDAGRLTIQALLAKGDLDRAQAIVLEMLQDQHPNAIEATEGYLRARKDPKAPRRLLEAYLVRGGRDSSVVIAAAELAADLGAADDAAAMLTKHLTGAPQNRSVIFRLARLYERTGDMQAAARQLAGLLALDDAELAQVEQEVRRLVGRGVKQDFVSGLSAAAAKAEGKSKPALLCLAGMFSAALDDGAAGKSLLRQAITAEAQFWPAYEALEEVYTAQGDFAAVDKLAEEVNRAAGDSYFWFYLVGKSQMTRAQALGAISNLEQARARNGRHIPTLLLLGQAYVQARRLPDAERVLLSAYSLAGDDVAANRSLFNFYLLARRRQDAGQVVARFLQAYPRSVPGRILLGRYYLATNETDRARTVLKELLAEAPDDVDVRLFELQFDLPEPIGEQPLPPGKAKSAMEQIQRILRLDKGNVEARARQAALLSNQGKYPEAASAWESLHRQTPSDLRVTNSYLDALIKAKLEDRAAAVVESLAGQRDMGPSLRLVLLDSLMRIKRYPLAEAILQQWLAQLAEKPEHRSELELLRYRALQVYEAAGDYDKAQGLLDEWIAGGPEANLLPRLRGEKLRMYAKAGKYDEGVAFAEKWAGNEPDSSVPRNSLVAALVEAKQYERADKLLDRWIAAASDPDLLLQLKVRKADLYAQQGQMEQLQAFGQRWLKEDAQPDQVCRLMIAVLLDQKKHDPALKWAEEWLARREQLPATAPSRDASILEVKRIIVEILLLAERKKEALARAEAIVKDDPKNVPGLRLLAAALRSLDKDDELLPVLEKILQLNPDDPGANNDLGYTWADRGVNLEKAEAMIRRALAAQPENAAVRDSFGWVLYKQGKFTEAKTVFDQIVATDPDTLHAIILDHAGDVCWRVGVKDEAARLWERAVELAKKDPRKEKDADARKVLAETPRKIEAAHKGQAPKVAPLGKGVLEPAGK